MEKHEQVSTAEPEINDSMTMLPSD